MHFLLLACIGSMCGSGTSLMWHHPPVPQYLTQYMFRCSLRHCRSSLTMHYTTLSTSSSAEHITLPTQHTWLSGILGSPPCFQMSSEIQAVLVKPSNCCWEISVKALIVYIRGVYSYVLYKPTFYITLTLTLSEFWNEITVIFLLITLFSREDFLRIPELAINPLSDRIVQAFFAQSGDDSNIS